MRIMLHGVSGNQKTADVTVVGTKESYVRVMQHGISEGRFFTRVDEANLRPVCTLGFDTARKLFPLKSPIGQVVKIGPNFFRVIGVMRRKGQTGSGGKFRIRTIRRSFHLKLRLRDLEDFNTADRAMFRR